MARRLIVKCGQLVAYTLNTYVNTYRFYYLKFRFILFSSSYFWQRNKESSFVDTFVILVSRKKENIKKIKQSSKKNLSSHNLYLYYRLDFMHSTTNYYFISVFNFFAFLLTAYRNSLRALIPPSMFVDDSLLYKLLCFVTHYDYSRTLVCYHLMKLQKICLPLANK